MKFMLSSESEQLIRNIMNGFKMHPMYAKYDIKMGTFFGQTGLDITLNGRTVNLFLFYADVNGKIDSFAIYGSNLEGHYKAMKSSMKAFDLPIREISMESGKEPFVDVYLDY